MTSEEMHTSALCGERERERERFKPFCQQVFISTEDSTPMFSEIFYILSTLNSTVPVKVGDVIVR